MADNDGVLKQHHDRMKDDEQYRKAALSINPDKSPASTGKYLPSTAPTKLSADQK